MDNRLKFLYCHRSELWGRRGKGRAGNEETGASGGGVRLENLSGNPKPLGGPKRSREASEPAAKKSRYCIYGTRTVNRHRWMRRES